LHQITTGKVYNRVIQWEREGKYLGKTVQIVPHITDCIKNWIKDVARYPIKSDMKVPEICIVEIGGTVGDIESSVFFEAAR